MPQAMSQETTGASSAGLSVRVVARGGVYALLFVAAMAISIDFVRFGGNVTPIWIASAILAWALIAAPLRDWPLIVGFAIVVHIARAVVVSETVANEAIYLATNIGSPLSCAALLRWRRDNLEFEDRASMFRFLLIAGVAAPSVSSAIVVAGSFVNPTRFNVEDIGVWFLADALSLVVFLPIFKSVSSGDWRDLLRPAMRVRALLLVGALVALLVSEWFMPESMRRVFPTLLIPYLIFIAFELGATGARVAVALSTVFFLVYAVLGGELARRGMAPVDYIFAVQVYLAAMVACVLPLAAALDEKQKLYETASDALADARAAWGDLIAAEAHYRLIADNSADMILRLSRDGVIVFASPACARLDADVDRLTGRPFAALADAADADRAREGVASALADGSLDRPHTMRLRLHDASGIASLYDVSLTLVASGNRDPDEFIAVLRQVQS